MEKGRIRERIFICLARRGFFGRQGKIAHRIYDVDTVPVLFVYRLRIGDADGSGAQTAWTRLGRFAMKYSGLYLIVDPRRRAYSGR